MTDANTQDGLEQIADLLEKKGFPFHEQEAIMIALKYGPIDGAHHKQWTIDQILRSLLQEDYDEVIALSKLDENGEESYGWDEGIAP